MDQVIEGAGSKGLSRSTPDAISAGGRAPADVDYALILCAGTPARSAQLPQPKIRPPPSTPWPITRDLQCAQVGARAWRGHVFVLLNQCTCANDLGRARVGLTRSPGRS